MPRKYIGVFIVDFVDGDYRMVFPDGFWMPLSKEQYEKAKFHVDFVHKSGQKNGGDKLDKIFDIANGAYSKQPVGV